MRNPGRLKRMVACIAALLLWAPAAPVSADSADSAGGAAPVYRPPQRGAPATRVGGGTRSLGERRLMLGVLAPDHTGLTIRAQPVLYWFASDTIPYRVEVSISVMGAVEPILEVGLEPPLAPGIHAFSLAKEGVILEADIDYQWFVSMVPDAEQRSRDLVSGNEIRHVAPSEGLRTRLAGAGRQVPAGRYAAEGLWYDALQTISERIAAEPGNKALRAQRAALLRQIGLSEAGAFELDG